MQKSCGQRCVIFHSCAQGVCHSSRLICSLMSSSSVTSRLQLDFHHIKIDFKKSEVVQPLLHCDVPQSRPHTLSKWIWKASAPTFLQEGKHNTDHASLGVLSPKGTPVNKQTLPQNIGLPSRGGSSLSDCFYHSLWKASEVCRVLSRRQTCRFHRSGRGCQIVPCPWERKSFLMGILQWGAIARSMRSKN